MNILKEKIKLSLSYPGWHSMMKKMQNCQKKKVILIGTPTHGNLGDHAIAIQEKYFFEDYFFEYEYFEILMPMYHTQKQRIKNTVKPDDLIVISGGGWMGNYWLHNEIVIREIVETYPKNKVIIFPQTVYYSQDEFGKKEYKITKQIFEKHNNLLIFAREQNSYKFIKKEFELNGKSEVYLAPDMVLYGKNIITKVECTRAKKKRFINVCIRQDCEAQQNNVKEFLLSIKKKYDIKEISTVVNHPVILRKRIRELQKVWKIFRDGEVTITDRLHAMLFSVLNGTPCIVLDNKTGKVFGVAEWIKDTNMVIKAESLDDAFTKLKKGKTYKYKEFEREQLKSYFDKMAEIIGKD